MKIDLNSYETASQALEVLARKGVLPLELSSKEAREQLAKALRDSAVWSARTTHARYLQELRKALADVLEGGRDNDFASIRLRLMETLQALEYDPETGFPGDAELGVPPAEPGSLRDLSSEKRIDFVLRTQIALQRNAALKARGMEAQRARMFPAWELIRVESRRVPRGSSKEAGIGWQRRWLTCGGPVLPSGRLVALKGDPVWAKLGNSTIFEDAMDVDIPPFAFQSGMGWREVARDEAKALGLVAKTQDGKTQDTSGGYVRMQEMTDKSIEAARRAYEAKP